VCIGYGFKERTIQEMERNYANAGRVISTLKSMVERLAPKQASLLDIRKMSATHQKNLVCDRTFARSRSLAFSL
jgi:hypothetical protein